MTGRTALYCPECFKAHAEDGTNAKVSLFVLDGTDRVLACPHIVAVGQGD